MGDPFAGPFDSIPLGADDAFSVDIWVGEIESIPTRSGRLLDFLCSNLSSVDVGRKYTAMPNLEDHHARGSARPRSRHL